MVIFAEIVSLNQRGQKDRRADYLIFFSLNTINARVVVIAQSVERRYCDVSGSIQDAVKIIQIFLLGRR